MKIVIGILRLCMGWIFLWPFLDKMFGLGFATEPGKGWIDGSSPIYGFLTYGTQGPFAEFFQSLAGNMFVEWVFMIGLLGIGVALMLGIGMRIATWSGVVMLLLMYVAALWPEHNPFIDDHIIYPLVLILLLMLNAGNYLGFGKRWSRSKLVNKFPIVR